MAGDPINAALWTDADVLVAPLGSPIPANAAAAFSGAWTRVGLLDGDAGDLDAIVSAAFARGAAATGDRPAF